jgi:hypothetical protein
MDILTLLETSWPARFAQNALWGFPILEICHLTGLTVVFGGMVMLDLRLLGLRRTWSAKQIQKWILPYVFGGFTVAFLSGFYLFIYQANRLAHDEAFLVKMLLLLPLAGLNALFMHFVAQRNIEVWDKDVMPPLLVRASAFLSLVLWVSILAAGRLIAYYYPYGF